MALRVVLVAQQALSVRSGVGTYARVLAGGLAARGLRITVATWTGEIDRAGLPGIDWIDLGPRPRLDPTPGGFWTLGRRAAAVLARAPCDIVHFLDAREAHVFARRRERPPVVATVHDDYAARASRNPLRFAGRCADPLRRWAYYCWIARLERACYARLDLLMVNSHATGRSIADCYGVAPARIRHVHLSVGPAAPVAAEALAGRPALLFAGGNFFRKGLDTVVRSLGPVARRLPGVRLHVAGEDRAAPAIRRLAERAGISGRVVLHGRVGPERIAAMIAGADLLVMPSRREALGLVYLEAFRAHVPVIAGDTGGVRELVADGESGLLVRPEDPRALAAAILRVAGDPGLRARLASGGRRVLEQRTPRRLVAETVGVYEEATAASAGASASQGDPVTCSSDSRRRRPIAAGAKVSS